MRATEQRASSKRARSSLARALASKGPPQGHVGRLGLPVRGRTVTRFHPLREAQRGLELVGLSGAAHPIRRLHHPGGEMMFPVGGGRTGSLGAMFGSAPEADIATLASRVKEAAAEEERTRQMFYFSKADEVRHGEAVQKHLEAQRAHAAALRRLNPSISRVSQESLLEAKENPVRPWEYVPELARGAAGAGAIGGLIYGGSKLGSALSGRGPTKSRQQLDQEHERFIATEGAARGGYKSDVDLLLRTKQISPSQQQQAYGWANRASASELRTRRSELRGLYKLPPLGRARSPSKPPR
jgi:hypothetical protein